MTDSVKLCLDLREMPDDARREVEVFHNRTQDKRWKFVSERYSKAIANGYRPEWPQCVERSKR